MPTPCESWPVRLAMTRFAATIFASRASLPPAATTACIAVTKESFLNKGMFQSFRLDAALFHHARPALDLRFHEGAELFRRAGHDVETDRVHALAHFRRPQGLHHGIVELQDDVARRPGRHHRR